MNRTIQQLAGLLLTAALAGCDQISDPTPPGLNGTGGGEGFAITVDTTATNAALPSPTRKVLLEDITGHRCNNCPRAARIAQALQDDVHGGDLVLVGVHAGGFALPYPPVGDGEYDSDHRTEAGIAYQETFQVAFFPAGMVNRKPYQGSRVVSEGSWASAVADIIDEPAPVKLWLDTIVVEEGTVSTVVKLHLAQNIQGSHNLVVYLTEDHVIDWQLDAEASPSDVPDYDHRHMLRANLNGTWGTPVINGSAPAGRVITLTIDNFGLDPDWNLANCALVAWLYDTATDQVVQADERKFQP